MGGAGNKDNKKVGAPPMYRLFAQGGIAAMAGGAASHPLDVIKVRLQIQGEAAALAAESGAASATRLGPVEMGVHIFKSQSVPGLFKGLSASLLRQGVYSSARFGAYDALKNTVSSNDGSALPFYKKVACGLISGAFGAAIGNPADVAMVRMQADGKLPPELRRNYKNVFDGLGRIVREEGVAELWRGCSPTVVRAMVVTASQLAVYDQIKQGLLASGKFSDTVPTHLFSGFLAGFFASCTSNPIDVVKTRIMNMTPGQYKGPIDCVTTTVRQEGPLALYKGFVPTFVRQAPFVMVTFVTLEQVKRFWKYLDGEL